MNKLTYSLECIDIHMENIKEISHATAYTYINKNVKTKRNRTKTKRNKVKQKSLGQVNVMSYLKPRLGPLF